jgi:hypothetical protein
MKYLISILLLIISLKSNSQILNLSFFSELMKLNNKSEMLLKLEEKNYTQSNLTELTRIFPVVRYNNLDVNKDSTYEIWLIERRFKDENNYRIGLITSDSLFAINLENEIKKEYILEKNYKKTTKEKPSLSGFLVFKDSTIMLNTKPYTYMNGTNGIRVKKNFKVVTNFRFYKYAFNPNKHYKLTKNKLYEFYFFKNLK